MISIRLPTKLETKLNQISETENITKSEISKRALILYFKKCQKDHSPYDLGKDLFGEYGSGDGNLSQNYKKKLNNLLLPYIHKKKK